MKNARKTNRADADPVDGGVDSRLETSPFASSRTTVSFSDGPELSIPRALLEKSPKLSPQLSSRSSSTLQLDGITSSVGHVLFYYLLTESYQCLKPKGGSADERLVDEFTTSIRVYIAAREYELPSLQKLAKAEIKRLADDLPFPLVLNLFQSEHLQPSAKDTWVGKFVKLGMNNLFENPTALLECAIPHSEHNVVSLSDIILSSLAQQLASKLTSVGNIAAAVPAQPIEPTVPEPEPVPIEASELPKPEPIGPDRRTEDPELSVPESKPEPETKAEAKEDLWVFNTSKRSNKKKKSSWDLLEEPEDVPAPEPVPALEPAPEPVPEAEPVTEFDDDWTSWGTAKKDKKKKKKITFTCADEPEPKPEPVLEADPLPEDYLWGNFGSKKTKKKSAKKRFTFGDLEFTCNDRDEHISGGGWKECDNCRQYVGKLSQQYSQIEQGLVH